MPILIPTANIHTQVVNILSRLLEVNLRKSSIEVGPKVDKAWLIVAKTPMRVYKRLRHMMANEFHLFDSCYWLIENFNMMHNGGFNREESRMEKQR